MIIGCPKEIKNHEYRVAITPETARALKEAGHEVWIERGAGRVVGYSDDHYREAGAKIVEGAKEVWQASMIVKVKEPQPSEFPLMKPGQILFCYLHLAPNPALTEALVDQKVVAIAFETVRGKGGSLPLLTPMSEIAGRLSVQVGAVFLQQSYGGKGVLLGGVPGVPPAKVVVVGGGVVGLEAARMALGLGAEVTILDNKVERLKELDLLFGPRLVTCFSNYENLKKLTASADLLIGAVLIPGALAPKLITREMVRHMEPGSVLVDVSIDQGGAAETSRPTSHEHPTYVEEGVLHYCVTNMPGAYAKTATEALSHATTPWILGLANYGYPEALNRLPGLREGVAVDHGKLL